MEILRAPLYLILLLVAIVISLIIFTGNIDTSDFPQGPTQVTLASTPTVSKLTPDHCVNSNINSRDKCEIPLRITGMTVKSNYTGDVNVVITFKGQEWLVPCGFAPNKRGPCSLTGDRTTLDIELDLSDMISEEEEGKLEPPTINITDATKFNGWALDSQRIILGNYSIKSVTSTPFVGTDMTLLSVQCNEEGQFGRASKTIGLAEGESGTLSLCAGFFSATVKDIRETESCLDITVAGAPKWDGPGESLRVSFWAQTPEFRGEQDLNPCGGLPAEFLQDVQYFDKFQFFTEVALADDKCIGSFLGGFELQSEVLPYNSRTSSWQVESC